MTDFSKIDEAIGYDKALIDVMKVIRRLPDLTPDARWKLASEVCALSIYRREPTPPAQGRFNRAMGEAA